MNDCYTNEYATHHEGCQCHEDAWQRRLAAVTAERDRLAEALNDLWYGHNLTGAAYELIEEALAAVKQPENAHVDAQIPASRDSESITD